LKTRIRPDLRSRQRSRCWLSVLLVVPLLVVLLARVSVGGLRSPEGPPQPPRRRTKLPRTSRAPSFTTEGVRHPTPRFAVYTKVGYRTGSIRWRLSLVSADYLSGLSLIQLGNRPIALVPIYVFFSYLPLLTALLHVTFSCLITTVRYSNLAIVAEAFDVRGRAQCKPK